MIVKGQLTRMDNGVRKQGVVWKMQTNFSEIAIGGQVIPNVVLPDDLKDYVRIGDTVELLILPFNLYEKTICGVRANGQSHKCGALYQAAFGLFFGVLFGWLILPLILSYRSLMNYLQINSF